MFDPTTFEERPKVPSPKAILSDYIPEDGHGVVVCVHRPKKRALHVPGHVRDTAYYGHTYFLLVNPDGYFTAALYPAKKFTKLEPFPPLTKQITPSLHIDKILYKGVEHGRDALYTTYKALRRSKGAVIEEKVPYFDACAISNVSRETYDLVVTAIEKRRANPPDYQALAFAQAGKRIVAKLKKPKKSSEHQESAHSSPSNCQFFIDDVLTEAGLPVPFLWRTGIPFFVNADISWKSADRILLPPNPSASYVVADRPLHTVPTFRKMPGKEVRARFEHVMQSYTLK